MMCYSIEPRDGIFVKGYGFLFFAKNMTKSIDKNKCKNLIGKSSQKLLDHREQPAADALNTTSKKSSSERTGDLIGNKIADKNTKISRTSLQNSSETVTNETENIRLDTETLKKYKFVK